MDKIFIKGLQVDAIIGIYPHERTKKQPLLIDIDLFTDISIAAKTKKIEDTIDYDLVAQRVGEIAEQGQFHLIESLIQSIVEALLDEFNIKEVHCTVCKPEARGNAQTVGISVSRKR